MLILKISDIATISVWLKRQPSKFIFNHKMKEHNRMEDFFLFHTIWWFKCMQFFFFEERGIRGLNVHGELQLYILYVILYLDYWRCAFYNVFIFMHYTIHKRKHVRIVFYIMLRNLNNRRSKSLFWSLLNTHIYIIKF